MTWPWNKKDLSGELLLAPAPVTKTNENHPKYHGNQPGGGVWARSGGRRGETCTEYERERERERKREKEREREISKLTY